ncbi:MAG: toast rack family protein [Melioribacteraceae bacterium]|nr:toast rack family protein [Melioribacteraceae bacterium]
MKSGQLFWGVFFLTLGGLFLMTRADIINSDFDFVFDLWPFFFILWGVLVIFKDGVLKAIVSAIFGLFVALMIFGFVYNIYDQIYPDFEDFDYKGNYSENYYQEFDSNISSARMTISTGAGRLNIEGGSTGLISGDAKGNLAGYDFIVNTYDSTAEVDIDYENNHFNIFHGDTKNDLLLKLNNKPLWDITLNVGAINGKLDLSDLSINRLELNTGASKLFVKLGDKAALSEVHLEMGATSFELHVPSNVGCKISTESVLSSNDFKDFIKKGKHTYETENYNSSEKKINISIEGGFTAFDVRQYSK